MRATYTFMIVVSALMSSACATTGGGPLGIVAFDRNQHVSAAEPLFGRGDMQCLDDPTFLLTLYAPTQSTAGTGKQASGSPSRRARDVCGQMRDAIRAALPNMTSPTIPSSGTADSGRYSDLQRNEVIDAIMAASDRKCGRYIAFLQQYDANVNSTFGILAQGTATLAAIASGGTAQGLAAAAGIAAGTRGVLNEAHFSNQTIGVLANAFEGKRAEMRKSISDNEALPVRSYTLMRGIQDATRYHASCSIVVGLRETQRAVDEARTPSLESVNKFLANLETARTKMNALLTPPATTAGGPTPPQGQPVTQPATPPAPAPATATQTAVAPPVD